ncbi:MAG: ATP-binding protein [Mangrovibacterium sp.]
MPANGKKRRTVSLALILSGGLLFSTTGFILTLTGSLKDGCLPGFLILLVIFLTGLLCLKNGQTDRAVKTACLLPFAGFFFFISDTYAILPPNATLRHDLWSLSAIFVFLLYFCRQQKTFTFFFLISLLTFGYHLWSAGNGNMQSLYQTGEFFFHPLLILTAIWLTCLLLFSRFNRQLQEIRKEKEKTEQIIDRSFRKSQQGLLVMDILRDKTGRPGKLRSVRVNHAFESIFKLGAREMRLVNADLIFPRVFGNVFDWNAFFLHTEKQFTKLYLEHLDKWIELYILSSEQDRIVCMIRDVTDRESQICRLEESSKRYRVLLEAIPDLFFIIDSDGIYMDLVSKETGLVRVNAGDIIGHSIFEVGFSEKMSRKMFQCIQHAISRDSIEIIEYALEVKQGTAMFELRIARLNDQSVIAIARDITRRKLSEIRLEEARKKAEEADELKSAFLASISHEIRTPMNAIIGFSRMIGSNDFEPEEKERFIDIIINNGKLLMEMIDNMISISKIESGQVTVNRSLCKLNDMLVELYREFSLETASKPVRLKLLAGNTNPKFSMVTDKVLLTEILKKLIDNAIKFTPRGEVEFGYRLEGNGIIRFFVRDTGIGIEKANLERIFERFLQIDHSTTRKYEGTGLGLAIARHYTELLGGKIEVKSEVDKGSDFSFTLPFADESSLLQVIL